MQVQVTMLLKQLNQAKLLAQKGPTIQTQVLLAQWTALNLLPDIMFQYLVNPAKQHVLQETINQTQARMIATLLIGDTTFQQPDNQARRLVQPGHTKTQKDKSRVTMLMQVHTFQQLDK